MEEKRDYTAEECFEFIKNFIDVNKKFVDNATSEHAEIILDVLKNNWEHKDDWKCDLDDFKDYYEKKETDVEEALNYVSLNLRTYNEMYDKIKEAEKKETFRADSTKLNTIKRLLQDFEWLVGHSQAIFTDPSGIKYAVEDIKEQIIYLEKLIAEAQKYE